MNPTAFGVVERLGRKDFNLIGLPVLKPGQNGHGRGLETGYPLD
jgi:hypothetical protein